MGTAVVQVPVFLDFFPGCHLRWFRWGVGQAKDGGCANIVVSRALLRHRAGDVALAVGDGAHGFRRLFPEVKAVDVLGQLLVCCIVWDGGLGADVLTAAVGRADVKRQVRAGVGVVGGA